MPHTNNKEVEELAEQLHIWYLEAVQQDGSKYNPDAVVPYKDLPEGSKLLDRYIANKVHQELQKAREEERERLIKDVHEILGEMGIDTNIHSLTVALTPHHSELDQDKK